MSLPQVLSRIAAAAERAGRSPDEARLVAVTKGHSLEEIERFVLRYGEFPLGENRVQEARNKIAAWPEREWHFIGPMQRNKVRYMRPFSLVHSIDSVELAEALAARAEREGYRPRILLEVNVAREPQKHGLDPKEVDRAVSRVRRLENVELRGLMTMAPIAGPRRGPLGLPRAGSNGRPPRPRRAFDGNERRLRGGGGRRLDPGAGGPGAFYGVK